MHWPAWRLCQGSCVKPRVAGKKITANMIISLTT